MQKFIVPTNSEALYRALVVVSGEEGAQLSLKVYQALDKAMAFAYGEGFNDASADKEAEMSRVCTNGYDTGVMDASADHAELNEDQLQFEFDEGYLEGVHDARVDPAEADRYVALLVAQDDFDESNVSDSGDEQPRLY